MEDYREISRHCGDTVLPGACHTALVIMLTDRQTNYSKQSKTLLVDIEFYAKTDTGVTGHHYIMRLSYMFTTPRLTKKLANFSRVE